jgi:chemotaxis protein MotB
MNRHIKNFMIVVVVGFTASACVSSGDYNKMEADKNKEITTLQLQNAELTQSQEALQHLKNNLYKQKDDLQQDNAMLTQQNTSAAQQNSAIQQKVGTLEQEKASMIAATQQRQQQYDALVSKLSDEVEKGQLKVRQYQNMLSVDLAEKIFFDSGKATLKKGGKAVLKKVGEALKDYDTKLIRVVGHTDNVPIAKSLQNNYPTNWELSVARATTVVRFLQDVGIPPQRLVASGRGEYDPVATNDTEEGRQANRRIEIMLIDKSLVNDM